MTIEESIQAAQVRTKSVTEYRIPADGPIVDAQDPGDRVQPINVTVTVWDDGEVSVSVTGYKVKKNGERKGAPWHGVSYEVQKQYEEALGYRRVPKAVVLPPRDDELRPEADVRQHIARLKNDT